MELLALRGLRETLGTRKPDLYIELHGTNSDHKRANGTAVMDLLWDAGYNILNVEENLQIIRGRQTGRESHIYCSASLPT